MTTQDRKPDRKEVWKAYAWLANSTEGRLILQDIQEQFGGKVAMGTAHETTVRAGELNVVQYLDVMTGQGSVFVAQQAGPEAIEHGMV